MSEGEFKKRMADLRREAIREIQLNHHSCHELGRHECISLILDEAKKELLASLEVVWASTHEDHGENAFNCGLWIRSIGERKGTQNTNLMLTLGKLLNYF